MTAYRSPRRSLSWLRRGGGVALLTAFLGLAVATPAAAHPYLLRSDPVAGSVLTTAPSQIDISYTEGLDRSYCAVVLVAPDGQKIQTRQVSSGAPTELAVVPTGALSEQGTYAVDWTAVGDDGHTVIGVFGFSIGHPSANAAAGASGIGTTGSAASIGGAQRLLRTVLPFFTVIFAGVLLLWRVIALSGRRAERLRLSAFLAQTGLLAAVTIVVISDGGISAFGASSTGHRLIAELVLTVLAVPVAVFRRFTRWVGPIVAVGLLIALAFSGHASSQPPSRRDLALAVYSIHLVAVSLWLGALIAVVLRTRGGVDTDTETNNPAKSLRPLVAASLVAVLITGVATTDWGLRNLNDVIDTSYGKLSIALLALFVVIIAVGLTASATELRRGNHRLARWLVGAEAVVAAATLLVAGVLGQIAQPLDQPYASQTYATAVGLPASVTASGSDGLDVAMLAPGIVGRNTLVVEVGHVDEEDFVSPSADVHSVAATLSCGGCGQPDQKLVLQPTGDGSSWTADVTLTKPATWLVTAAVQRGSNPVKTVQLADRVVPASLPHQVVIGVPTSLSGPNGETCRDQTLGLQVAVADLNTKAADHGDLIRVVAVDLHDGVAAALSRLTSLGARMIALPCGTTSQVEALSIGARARHLPVVIGTAPASPTTDADWSTQPSWQAEGAAIAGQAIRQDANGVTAVVGASAIDQAELTGLRSFLATHHVRLDVAAFPRHADRFVSQLSRGSSDVIAVLGNRDEAAPLVHAFSVAEDSSGWVPSHGILASAQLMSTDFINNAGTITRLGGIEFASDINPFDPVSQYYAQRLRALSPGVRPSFDGLHGYEAGLAIAEALKDGGGDPSAARLTTLFGQRFHDFSVGSYRLGWGSNGGTSTSLAFFRSTYVNPMAMPSDTPGGASSLAHEGTFLDTGGFEQVAPFRTVQ